MGVWLFTSARVLVGAASGSPSLLSQHIPAKGAFPHLGVEEGLVQMSDSTENSLFGHFVCCEGWFPI